MHKKLEPDQAAGQVHPQPPDIDAQLTWGRETGGGGLPYWFSGLSSEVGLEPPPEMENPTCWEIELGGLTAKFRVIPVLETPFLKGMRHDFPHR